MAKKSKKFRIATEGATADGRVIDRAWIQQMADGYDPTKYRATINLEHIRGIVPDSPFRNYGFVDALSSGENADGKLELFATITPTDDLVAMVQKGQKVFTSIEVNPKFADTGKAYLVGLAVTDNPASLGTEMLQFAAANPNANPLTARKQHPENSFTAATEAHIDFVEASGKPSLTERIREMFRRKEQTDDARFSDLTTAIEEIAKHGEAQSTQTAEQFQQVDSDIKATNQSVTELTKRLDELSKAFNTTAAPAPVRPLADGSKATLAEF